MVKGPITLCRFFPLYQLAVQNGGRAHLIPEDSDTALQLQKFYKEVQQPLLTGVRVNYSGEAVEESSTSKTDFANFFHGSELVVSGRFNQPITALETDITGNSVTGRFHRRLRVDVTQGSVKHAHMMKRLWAYLTIRRLLETAAVSTNNSIVATAKTRTLDLSLRVCCSITLSFFLRITFTHN